MIFDIRANKVDGEFATCGITSSIYIPGNGSTYYTSQQLGSTDAFFTLFFPTAGIKHRTIFGGSAYDISRAIFLEKHGSINNIVVIGYTFSNNFINTSSSGINDNMLNGDTDGFLISFSNDGTTIFCDSYIGGDGSEQLTSISSNDNGKILVGGFSSSTSNFNIISSGTGFNQDHNGYSDAFIMKIDNNLNLYNASWRTFIGGSEFETLLECYIDDNGKIWILGTTDSYYQQISSSPTCPSNNSGLFPICTLSGGYNQTIYGGGFGDYFLAHFDSDEKMVYCSYLGTDGQEEWFTETFGRDGGMFVNSLDEVFITGTIGTPGIGIPFTQINPTSYNQTTFLGDAGIPFISKFNSDFSLAWYTYFGANDAQWSTSHDISVDEDGFIYIGGRVTDIPSQLSADYCSEPSMVEWPICDSDPSAYVETNDLSLCTNRSFLAQFNQYGHLTWSTKYGDNCTNSIDGIDANNKNAKLYVAGYGSNYTIRTLNGAYNQSGNMGNATWNGTMARFSTPNIIGISEQYPNLNLIVFPNPTNNYLSLQYNTDDFSSYSIIDIYGRIIVQGKIIQSEILIDVSGLIDGAYILQVISKENAIFNATFIKQ